MPSKFNAFTTTARRRNPSNTKKRDDFGAELERQQRLAIETVYGRGGVVYLQWCKQLYKTHEGKRLKWNEPFFEEFFLLMGNLWFEVIFVEKPAQVGFSEALISFSLFFLAYLRLPFGLGFEQRTKLQQMVGKRVQPAFDYCSVVQELASQRQGATNREDIDSKETITIGGVALSLFYAGTQSQKKDGYQAPANLRSFTAFGVAADEWGLWPEGAIYVAMARMEQSPLPSKPIIRAGSTPGYEGSPTDAEMRRAKYLFQWHCDCPHCHQGQFIDPFGNLLRPTLLEEEGIAEEMFVSPIGRPLSWFHHSENPPGVADADLEGDDLQRAFDTAYVGCSFCAGELTFETMSLGEFRCVNTGISLLELERSATRRQTPIKESVGIRLPKLASVTFKAPERIRFQWYTKKPDDGIHQFLGKPFSLGGGKISLARLLACVGLAMPFQRKPDFVAAGIDQGRNANYCIVMEWYLGEQGDKDQQWMEAHTRIIYYEEFQTFERLDELARIYNIALFFVDNEPEFQLAAAYAMKHLPERGTLRAKTIGQVYLLDQVQLKGEQYKRTERDVQSTRKDTKIIVYSVDRTYAIDCVKWRIYRRRMHFPEEITYDPKDAGNLLHHYMTSDRTPDGRWVEPTGEPDHYLNAHSLCEIGVQLSAYEPGQKKGVFITTASR